MSTTVIIGGGAAGFFAAISERQHHPDRKVVLLERTEKLLSKVKVSGGGRCNVTNACTSVPELVKNYPNGGNALKKAFQQFSTVDTVSWFQSRGVQLKTEPDNRMFPITDSSQTIIDCLQSEARKLKVEIRTGQHVLSVTRTEAGFELVMKESQLAAGKLIIATGGSPKDAGYDWLRQLGHTIVPPIPSLFTFNIPNDPIRELMGVSVENATVRIGSTKLSYSGPLLITHWGMSGPAVLKLSAFGARLLHEKEYRFEVLVNWVSIQNEYLLREKLTETLKAHPNRSVKNEQSFGLPMRLWHFLIERSGNNPEQKWSELQGKNLNRLVNNLMNDSYRAEGKTTFKEEFVTSGGVELSEVDFNTMESRIVKNLHFAGEVLNVDGITGGFNFQAAWTTGFLAGKA